MSVEQRFTPIPTVHTDRLNTTRLRLPYQVEEALAINTKRTAKHMQLGGIATLSLNNDRGGNVPMVVGMTQNGQALAGFTRETTPAHSTNLAEPGLYKSAVWSDLSIYIDENISVDTLKRNGKDIQNPESWIPIVENATKDGILSASIDNLIKRSAARNTINALVLSMQAGNIYRNAYPNLTFGVLFWQGLIRYLELKIYGVERPGKGLRWSIAVNEFPEIDRMAIQSLSLPFAKIVKVIK